VCFFVGVGFLKLWWFFGFESLVKVFFSRVCCCGCGGLWFLELGIEEFSKQCRLDRLFVGCWLLFFGNCCVCVCVGVLFPFNLIHFAAWVVEEIQYRSSLLGGSVCS
jgi:hypothetical protein